MGELWAIVVIFWGALVLGFTGAVAPGPVLAATLIHARRRGWVAGVLVSTGHALPELILVAAIAIGVGTLLAQTVVARTVALAGGAFLLAGGILTAVRPPRAGGEGPSATARRGTYSALLAGVWTSVSQPYWFVWWVTVGAAAALAAFKRVGLAGIVAFFLGHVLADFVWLTLVAAAVGAGRDILSHRIMDGLTRACGIVLALFGLAFLAVGTFWPGLLSPHGV
jgi:threonine/homoserine/homoserine lactone efflux protein